MERLVDDFLLALVALISIINPVGVVFVFREMTVWAAASERKRLATRIALYALAVILASYFVGTFVLAFFGITLPALRIGGGLVVAAAGWNLLQRRPEQAGAPQAMDTAPIMQMAFFPLTMPLTTGPGTIAVSIALGAARSERTGELLATAVSGFMAAALVMAGIIWLAYRNADRIVRLAGNEGSRVITTLSAFLLLCVGIQIMLGGISEFAAGLLAAR
jgi:multiple antibiotic resistance protein